MKLLKNIVARILAIWSLLVFASTMFIFIWFYLICYLLPEPQKTRWHRQVSQLWMGLYLIFSGCRFKVTGKENFNNLPKNVKTNNNSLRHFFCNTIQNYTTYTQLYTTSTPCTT